MPLTRRAFVVGGANTAFIGKKHPDFHGPVHELLISKTLNEGEKQVRVF